MLNPYQTNVLLPRWLLDQRPTLTNKQFLSLTLEYLTPRYPDYHLVSVDNDLAVCTYARKEKKE